MNSPARVWVVDDSALDRDHMTRTLAERFSVESFSDASVAIERLSSARALPDVIIVDWVMPEIDGLEVCRFVRSHPATTGLPVLMVTVHQSTADLVHALDCGADDFLRKPLEPAELVARVATLVRSRRSERAQAAALERLERLQRLTAALAACVRAEDVAAAMFEHVAAEFGEGSCTIALLDPDGTTFRMLRNSEGDELLRFPLGEPMPLTEAIRDGHSVWVESPEQLAMAYPALVGRPGVEGFGRWVALPLVGGGARLGALGLSMPRARPFSAQERDAFERLAAVAGAALDRARLYDEERHARELAAASAAFEKELVAIVSHDLRNPLAAAVLCLEQASRTSDAGHQHLYMRRAERSVARMRTMIDQLLDLTRVRLGSGIPINRATCDLARVTEEVASEVRAANPDARIDIDVQGDVRGEWDPDRLAQLLGNLVSNAVQHGEPGAPVRVEVRGERDGVIVSVNNDGKPIPAPKIVDLFEPFRRGHGAGKGGLGLGLYIAREIARGHDGTLELTSTAETGTTVRLALPRGQVRPSRAMPSAARRSSPIPEGVPGR